MAAGTRVKAIGPAAAVGASGSIGAGQPGRKDIRVDQVGSNSVAVGTQGLVGPGWAAAACTWPAGRRAGPVAAANSERRARRALDTGFGTCAPPPGCLIEAAG